MNEQLNITEIKNNENDIASRFDCQVIFFAGIYER